MCREIDQFWTHVNGDAKAPASPLNVRSAVQHDSSDGSLTYRAAYATVAPCAQVSNDNDAIRTDGPIIAVFCERRLAVLAHLSDALAWAKRKRAPPGTRLVRVTDGRLLARVARPDELIMPSRGPTMGSRSYVLSNEVCG